MEGLEGCIIIVAAVGGLAYGLQQSLGAEVVGLMVGDERDMVQRRGLRRSQDYEGVW